MFRRAFKFVEAHPLELISVCFFAGHGIADYNRDVLDMNLTGFKRNNVDYLGETLSRVYWMAFHKDSDLFCYLSLNASSCEETWYMYQKAERKIAEARKLPALKDKYDYEFHRLVVKEYTGFTKRMCRRAMIRNKYYFKWLTAVVWDEFLWFLSFR